MDTVDVRVQNIFAKGDKALVEKLNLLSPMHACKFNTATDEELKSLTADNLLNSLAFFQNPFKAAWADNGTDVDKWTESLKACRGSAETTLYCFRTLCSNVYPVMDHYHVVFDALAEAGLVSAMGDMIGDLWRGHEYCKPDDFAHNAVLRCAINIGDYRLAKAQSQMMRKNGFTVDGGLDAKVNELKGGWDDNASAEFYFNEGPKPAFLVNIEDQLARRMDENTCGSAYSPELSSKRLARFE